MSNTLKFILIAVFIIILGLGAGVFYLIQKSWGEETSLEEIHDQQGRILSRKVNGWHAREGSYLKTIIFDTLGRKTKIYGYDNDSRIKEIYRYKDSTLVFEGKYFILNDTSSKDFEISNVDLSNSEEKIYHLNGTLIQRNEIGFYSNDIQRDTFYRKLEKYDNLGMKLLSEELRFERQYFHLRNSDTITGFLEFGILLNNIENRKDTIRKDTIKFEFPRIQNEL